MTYTKLVIRTLEELTSIPFNYSVFSFDTETKGLDALKYFYLELDILSMCDGIVVVAIDFENNEETGSILHYLKSKFECSEVIIAHNIVFDLKVIHKYGIYPYNVELFDTMIADHLINENREHGLKFLTKNILNKDVDTWEESHTDRTKYLEYALMDAINTWELALLHKEELKVQGLTHLFRDIEMPFQWVLLDMEVNGVKINLPKVKELTEQLHIQKGKTEETMLKFLGVRYDKQTDLLGNSTITSNINFSSNQQLGEILFGRFGLEIIETTPGGAPSVGIKTIDTYKSSVPFVELLSKYKIIQKLLTAFFIPLPTFMDEDGRIRPNFRDIGAKTGRLSCQNPNLQQLPKSRKGFEVKTRECFIVEPGYKMITCDYSGQELRVLAHISKDPTLIESFREGYDLHLSTANDFFNLNIPKEYLKEDNPHYEENKTKFKKERDKSKTINFGMAYGKGAYGFSKDFNISETEAQEILNKYFAALPKVKEAIDNAHKMVREKGYVSSLTGRRRRFIKENGYYPSGAYRQSFNFLIQGYSADMIRMAAIKTLKLSRDNPHWGLKHIMTVHDEVGYEVKEEYAEEAGFLIKQCFETAVELTVKLKADVNIGDNYEEAK